MRMILTYDNKGTITSVAFLGEDVADDLELEPGPGEQVIPVDSKDLPERVEDSELRGERLEQYQRQTSDNLQVVNGRIVRASPNR